MTLTDSTGATVGTPATTAADGTYTLTGIPAAAFPMATTYTLTVTAPGFAQGTPLTETVYYGSTLTGQNSALTPIPPGSILATVVYSTGGPVPGAVVSYTAPGGTAQTVTTNANGTVTIAAVPPATYSVSATGPNNANGKPTTDTAPAQSVVVTSGAQTPVTFTVTAIPPSFSGTVTGSTNGVAAVPLANAVVTVTGTDATGAAITPVSVKPGTDGTYTTPPLSPGTYTLTVSPPGFMALSQGPFTVQFGDVLTGINFALTSVLPGSITGTVKDSFGNPVSGASVTFKSSDGTFTTDAVLSNPDGSFLIPPSGTAGVPAGTSYVGTAVGPNNANGKPAYGAGNNPVVTVPAGGSASASFVLPAVPASVSGTVTDVQTGAPVASATVTLTNPAGVVIGTQTTGADGAYSFTGIPAAQAGQTYTVTVTKAGYFPNTTPVTLSLGDAMPLPIAFNEQATLYGLITDGSQDATGQPLPGVALTVTDATGAVVATVPAPLTTQTGTTAGPDGKPQNYTAAVLPGTYTVTASKGSYTSKTSAAVTVGNTAPVRVDLALVSSIGTLGGLVTDQNGTTPVAGATVTAVLTTTAGTTAAGVPFTTSGTATAGGDGKPVNYTGQLSQGMYTVTVTKGNRTTASKTITIVGGAFNRLDFAAATGLPALHTFAAGFQFVSTPYDYSALGFDGLFGVKNTAPSGATPNGNRSSVAVWNPLVGAYALDPTPPADTLRLGVGYWVYLKNAVPVTVQGATPSAPTVRVSLGKGWNQIGVPRPTGIAVTDLAFDNGTGGTISYSQASSSQYNLLTYPLYSYAGGGYQALLSTSTLQPWNAYWIYVNAPATLVLPTQ